jgi:hypothetical protein
LWFINTYGGTTYKREFIFADDNGETTFPGNVVMNLSSLTPYANGNQSGSVSFSVAAYQAHSMTQTGNLTITTTNWPSGKLCEAKYVINRDTTYGTLTIDGFDYSYLDDGWHTITVSKIEGTTDVMGGMSNELGGIE